MLKPKDFTHNLARDFPGSPEKNGQWVHDVTIAGITFEVSDSCHRAQSKGRTEWSCKSDIAEAGNQRGRLFDIKMVTEIDLDRHGLFRHTFTYDAVLVRASSGGQLSHHAAAGKRQVQRLP